MKLPTDHRLSVSGHKWTAGKSNSAGSLMQLPPMVKTSHDNDQQGGIYQPSKQYTIHQGLLC